MASVLLHASSARADTVPAITNSDYGLDLFQGPVTTASRVIGMGGAYTALAEWCEGEYSNAASPAVRPPYSVGKRELDICFGFTNPGAFAGNDFENRGAQFSSLPTRFTNATTFNLGLQLQYGPFGGTVVYDQLHVGLEQSNGKSDISAVIDRVTGSLASSFSNDQLLIGVGFRTVAFNLNQVTGDGNVVGGNETTLVSRTGAGTQVGVIWKPRTLPFRLGATYRSELVVREIRGISELPDGSQVAGNRILPNHLTVPWELEIGTALELGRRPLNPPRVGDAVLEERVRGRYDERRLARATSYAEEIAKAPEPMRERVRRGLELRELRLQDEEEAAMGREIDAFLRAEKAQAALWDRHQMLLLASVLVTGPSPNSVGIADFVAQRRASSGENTVLSVRLGFETEVVRNWVMLRGGTYLEPTRFDDSTARAHFTLGTDIRLFRFNPLGLFGDDPWRLRLAADLAPRYFNWAFALGKYH